jgi:phospholipase/lecithinase/hemolysin
MQLTLEVRKSRLALRIILMLLLAFVSTFAYAKNYNTIVVFGDSLSDTGNDAHLTAPLLPPPFRIPGPIAYYTDGRFTDGADTTPYARNYFGVWVEQFAATLPSRPEVRNSLDGGTDYAYGFATSGNLTSPGPLGVQVNNIGQQITDYLATNPQINDSTLFIVWGGANDFIHTTPTSITPEFIRNIAFNITFNVQRLIDAGATQFIVANLPPLGLTPYMLGSDAATNASAYFNAVLAGGISYLRETYPHKDLTIFELNVFTLFQQIADSPSSFSVTNFTEPSQCTPAHPERCSVNPDTYLFWDDVHPTTRGHNILSDAASRLISQHQCNAKGENCVYPPPCDMQGNHCASPAN